jgi:hypothetical protein
VRSHWTLTFALAACAPGPTEPSGPAEPFDPLPLPGFKDQPPSGPGRYFRDADGDGWVGTESMEAPSDPDGAGTEWVPAATAIDCDDDPYACGAACHPNFAGGDRCDGYDQDCDLAIDEDPDLTWFRDRDGDGAGDPLSAASGCDPIDGYVDNSRDCDDDPGACGAGCSPYNVEAIRALDCADGIDNDCDGRVDAEAPGCNDNRPPLARFVIDPGAAPIDTPIDFDAGGSSDPEGDALSYSWDFDSDGTFELSARTSATARWTFTTAGVHSITLRVEDPRGAFGEFVGYTMVESAERIIVVTSTADSIADDGVTTLREAIGTANARVGPDTISFAGPLTITLDGGPLPTLAGQATLAGRRGVVVRGSATATNYCLEIEGEVAVLWLEIAGCVDDGLEAHGSGQWLAHVKSHDNGDDGIDITGAANRIGPDNAVWNNGDAGFEIEGIDNLIEGNRAASNHAGIRFLAGLPATGTMIVRNTIPFNDLGMIIAPEVDRLVIWQNTLYGNGGNGLRFDAPAANLAAGMLHDVRNNVFNANSGWAISTSGGFAALSSNAFFENALGTCNGCDTDPLGIAADPELMDPAGGDFRLGPISPCIDAGEDLGLGFQGAAPDLGAFERVQ